MKERITDEMIEEKLSRAIEESAPDMLDSLMAELGISDESPEEQKVGKPEFEPVKPAGKKIPDGFRKYLAACAALLLVFAGFSVFHDGGAKQVVAVVGIDVNPSIELSLGEDDKVISAEGLNNDGKEVLDGMTLKGIDAKAACNAVTGAMLAKGYLSDTSNSVLISVRSADAEKGRKIETELADDLNNFLNNSQISGAILGQIVEEDDELDDFAEEHGISIGKAWLIRTLLASGNTNMSEESLLMLSTQELILLGQEKHVHYESSYGSADTSKYIGHDKAISTALEAAGISSDQAEILSVEFDAENGIIVYEVEFTANGIEYEYNIGAEKGNVISHEYDGDDADDNDDDDDDDDDDHEDDDDDDED